MINLSAIRHLIIDMDGVLWHGDHPLPPTSRFFATLREPQLAQGSEAAVSSTHLTLPTISSV